MNATRMRNTKIFIGQHVWSCLNDFSWILFIFFSPGKNDTKNNSGYIKLSFSIGYFDFYIVTRGTLCLTFKSLNVLTS